MRIYLNLEEFKRLGAKITTTHAGIMIDVPKADVDRPDVMTTDAFKELEAEDPILAEAMRIRMNASYDRHMVMLRLTSDRNRNQHEQK